MQRRNFLIGAAGTAIGGSALVGSGAFSSVEADRGVTVAVADDNDAYLGLEAVRDDIISDDGDDGQLTLDLGSQTTNEDAEHDGQGEGFNREAITEIDGVFRITNQGTETVDLEIENDVDGLETTLQDPNDRGPGDSTLVDIEVDTKDHSPQEAENGTVVISAGRF